MTVLLYGGATWSLLDKHLNQLSLFQMRWLRRIGGISLLDHITNHVILKQCDLTVRCHESALNSACEKQTAG